MKIYKTINSESQAKSYYQEITPLKKYYTEFIQDGKAPFILQLPEKKWFEIKPEKIPNITDRMLLNHLEYHKYWLGIRGAYYPRYAYLDFDAPTEKQIEKVIETLKLKDNQYHLFTSPSYYQDNSIHLIIKPHYNDKPPTLNLLQTIFKPYVKPQTNNFEIFPHKRKKFRSPFGLNQNMIDKETGQILNYSWIKNMEWCEKLDEYDLETLNQQLNFNFSYSQDTKEFKQLGIIQTTYMNELYEYGLTSASIRHNSILSLAHYFYRQNLQPQQTKQLIHKWIMKKHNGFSNTINQGKFLESERDIIKTVDDVYCYHSNKKYYPDTTNNFEGCITKDDIDLIADVFPNDVVNQKRMFALLCYYRPRARHEWVFIPRSRWIEIVNFKYYKSFQNILSAKGVLETIDDYRIGAYSKRFRIKALNKQATEVLSHDYRNIQQFTLALRLFPVDYIKNKLSLSPKTIYNIFHNR